MARPIRLRLDRRGWPDLLTDRWSGIGRQAPTNVEGLQAVRSPIKHRGGHLNKQVQAWIWLPAACPASLPTPTQCMHLDDVAVHLRASSVLSTWDTCRDSKHVQCWAPPYGILVTKVYGCWIAARTVTDRYAEEWSRTGTLGSSGRFQEGGTAPSSLGSLVRTTHASAMVHNTAPASLSTPLQCTPDVWPLGRMATSTWLRLGRRD